MINLRSKVEEKITGFTGIVVGIVTYLSGSMGVCRAEGRK